ncbi:PQQ-dependent sugar dehydrogenase [Tahibacter amnicola]|uniref:PQQ-dependent sugar dehydrogenase n=1 Tax=Tahibacter amnicola TaxID=2976241 RepID=A0ABY6BE26_9GAMM|nr:PQQ-dependent sugar dehydrogenase [Tahibacter amnicola]UXI68042.1 PQQ-dependent sugar dehydrogenase [Tahibacter amnicola]
MKRYALLCGLLLAATTAGAQGPIYVVDTLAEGLDHPWSLEFLPDGRQLVTERAGRLRMIENGTLVKEPVDGVPPVMATGQGGLFEVLADPRFGDNQTLYLSFADGTPDANRTRVISARLEGRRLRDVRTIFAAEPTKRGGAHFGGRMTFLADGTLVIGLGDGFNYRDEAQNLQNHFGKIVRINRDGSVPADNPFLNRKDARPEIYSLGHRNVQGIAFDRAGGRLYAHEHGPKGGDEVNRIEPGKNYGWPLITYGVDYSGAQISPYTERPGLEQPLLHWTPSIAPAGMALYRGDEFPAWRGSLIVTALAAQKAQRVPIDGDRIGTQETLFAELKQRLRQVRVDADGVVYLLTDDSQGKVLRVRAASRKP